MLLILPFCISHYTSPIILSFLPIILKSENSENTYWGLQFTHAHIILICAYLSLNYRYKYLPLVLGSDSRVTVVDARLSPLDGELGDLQAASSSTVPREFLRILSDYSRIIPIL